MHQSLTGQDIGEETIPLWLEDLFTSGLVTLENSFYHGIRRGQGALSLNRWLCPGSLLRVRRATEGTLVIGHLGTLPRRLSLSPNVLTIKTPTVLDNI